MRIAVGAFFLSYPADDPMGSDRNTCQCHQTSSIDRRSSIDLRPKFSIEPLIVRFVPRVRACERCRLTAYIRSPAYDLLLNGGLIRPIEEPSLCSDEKHLRDFRHNGRSEILKPSVPDPRIIYLIFATFAPKAFSVGAAYL